MSESKKMGGLETKYQELHNQFRHAFDLFFKGSSLALAVAAFSLGYLFKVPLDKAMSRAISGFVLILLCLWYVCTFWILRLYASLTRSIEDTSQKLGYSFEIKNYNLLRTVVISGMCAAVFAGGIFVYLWIRPLMVSQPVP